MLEKLTNNLTFSNLTETERNRGILGRLYGPIASCVVPTRNGRYYPDEVWETVFDSPIVKEMFTNGGLPGELDHPVDRSETDSSRIAIMMPEPPKRDTRGQLEGYFDILDTPCGKIAYQLAKYGFRFGISSRGEGDVTESYDGSEVVDADTYTLHAFDLVLLPACESARMRFTESLDTKKKLTDCLFSELSNSPKEARTIMLESLRALDFENKGYVNESLGNKTLYESLNEAIEAASSDDDKIIMANSLERVGIDYKDKGEAQVGTSDVSATDDAAANDGADLVKDLQEALKANAELSKQVTKLQEKLSVCYAKEVRTDAAVTKLKNAVVALSEDARKYKAVSSQIVSLKEQLDEKATQFVKQNKVIESFRRRFEQTSETIQQLTESSDTKDVRIKTLVRRNNELQEQLNRDKSEHEKVVSSLQEELEGLRTDAKVIKSQCEKKLASANKLIEQYRKESDTAKKLYVESKAKQLGVGVDDVTNRLTENYTFEDVNKVCENLRDYKLNMSKLPFNIDLRKGARVTVNESKDISRVVNPDDVLDDSITNLLSNIQ